MPWTLIISLVGLFNTGAAAALKVWADKRAQANRPDIIKAQEAQVQQQAADADNAAMATAMKSGTPEAKADPKVQAAADKALEDIRKEDAE